MAKAEMRRRLWMMTTTTVMMMMMMASQAAAGPSGALFVFGDSIVDPGNNNHLVTLAKVDYYPYGMDFPSSLPTGRFSNGLNPADYLALKMGLPLIPAYHNPATKGKRLLQGVNFASGGSGIHTYTGRLYGDIMSLEDQVRDFEKVKEEIAGIIGEDAADELLAEAGYFVVTGSNDWLLSYYSPVLVSPLRSLYTVPQFSDDLADTLISHVEEIYKLGARKIIVAGLPALGCCPSQLLAYNSSGSCVAFLNDICSDFNQKLSTKVLALNQKLINSTMMYIDVFTPVLDAAQNPSKYGFKIGNDACCGIGRYGGFLTCLKGLHPCENVEEHVYWDAYHPTQKLYPQLIDLIWKNGPPYAYPSRLQDYFGEPTVTPTTTILHTEL